MDNRLKRAPGIYLAGFMGCGKSTVAQQLADRLGWNFIDLDTEIETAENDSIANIFARRGESEFRSIESAMLKSVMRRIERGVPTVVALGGGAFAQRTNTELLEGHGISVWLDCTLETVEARVVDVGTRPLARDKEAFRRLYEERRAAYGQANYRIDADCDVARAVDLILELPCWK
ncbi:MAG: shikimate kinase [Acidobacteriota bacterium]|nr:shikimate kinase [Acidobacteriota bacterium]